MSEIDDKNRKESKPALLYSGLNNPICTWKKWRYRVLKEGYAEIIGYDGEEASVKIPDTIKGHAVVMIGQKAFEGMKSLAAVSIPGSVRWIGTAAFKDCVNLSSVKLSEELEWIFDRAFENCIALTEVVFTNCLEMIDTEAFSGCKSLRQVKLKGTCLSMLMQRAFMDCTLLERVILPDSLGYIGTEAFRGCTALADIYLSPNTKCSERVFSGCTGLVDNEGFIVIDGRLAGYYGTQTHVQLPKRVTSITEDGFYPNGKNIQSVKFHEGVKYMGKGALRDLRSLKEVVIPGSVETLRENCFFGCTSLENIIIEEGLKYIEHFAFYAVGNIKRVEIPASVKQIRLNAFSGVSIGEISCLKGSVMDLYASIFQLPVSYRGTLPGDTFEAYEICEEDWEFAGSALYKYTGEDSFVFIPEQWDSLPVTDVLWHAFKSLPELLYVRFPKTINLDDLLYSEMTGDDAIFYKCPNLQRVDVPGLGNEVPGYLFKDCEYMDIKNNKLWFEVRSGAGWEYVKFFVNGEMLQFRISYIGPMWGKFVSCVEHLNPGGEDSITWMDEPGFSTWQLSRDDKNMLHYDVDGYSGVVPYDEFLEAVQNSK